MITIVGVLADLAAVMALLFGIMQYKNIQSRENKIATIEAYARLQTEALDELNHWSPSEIREAVNDRRSDAYKILSSYLARIECFCAGIVHDIYDFDVFYDIAHGYFDGKTLKNRLIPLLERKLDRADEDYFRNIQVVWKRMEKGSEHHRFFNLVDFKRGIR